MSSLKYKTFTIECVPKIRMGIIIKNSSLSWHFRSLLFKIHLSLSIQDFTNANYFTSEDAVREFRTLEKRRQCVKVLILELFHWNIGPSASGVKRWGTEGRRYLGQESYGAFAPVNSRVGIRPPVTMPFLTLMDVEIFHVLLMTSS
jgi:hypothetical protein